MVVGHLPRPDQAARQMNQQKSKQYRRYWYIYPREVIWLRSLPLWQEPVILSHMSWTVVFMSLRGGHHHCGDWAANRGDTRRVRPVLARDTWWRHVCWHATRDEDTRHPVHTFINYPGQGKTHTNLRFPSQVHILLLHWRRKPSYLAFNKSFIRGEMTSICK